MKRNGTTALLALSGLALFSPSANASLQTTYNQGDLLVGFHQQGAASGKDYEIDFGPISNFIGKTAPFTITTGLAIGTSTTSTPSTATNSTNLTTAFTSNWFTLSSPAVLWGAMAGDTAGNGIGGIVPAETIFVTAARTSAGTAASPWTASTISSQTTTLSTIDRIMEGTGGFNHASGTGTGNDWYLQTASGSNSWSSGEAPDGTVANSNGTSLGTYSPTIEGPVNEILDLFEVKPSNSASPGVVDLGTLSVANTGAMTFTPIVPVPEPGTACFGLALTGLAVIARRKCRQT